MPPSWSSWFVAVIVEPHDDNNDDDAAMLVGIEYQTRCRGSSSPRRTLRGRAVNVKYRRSCALTSRSVCVSAPTTWSASSSSSTTRSGLASRRTLTSNTGWRCIYKRSDTTSYVDTAAAAAVVDRGHRRQNRGGRIGQVLHGFGACRTPRPMYLPYTDFMNLSSHTRISCKNYFW